jgi:protein-S-isoprenylcysteine O-methyltransferase
MSANIIAAITAINICVFYYLVSEIILSIHTKDEKDKSIDQGTQRLVWILLVSCFIVAWVPVILDLGRLLILGAWLTWIGTTIMIAGIIFRQYSISVLGKFFTGQVSIQANHKLIKEGPYRHIRHPSYLGILIITAGLGIALSNWVSIILCVVLSAIGIIRRIKVEEKELESHFGKQYEDYKKCTWAVIPYIY